MPWLAWKRKRPSWITGSSARPLAWDSMWAAGLGAGAVPCEFDDAAAPYEASDRHLLV